MAGNVFTGIDIGSESIKFVTARKGRGGKLEVLNAGIASIGDVSALPEGDARTEGIAAILKGLLADRRASVRKAYTCVSGKKVITRYTHVPPMPPHRLEKVMAFEIDNEAPGGGENIASDFKLLDLPNKDAEFTILVGMAKEDVIDGQKRILESVGARVADVTLGCLPTFHSFVYCKRAELDSMPGPCAVVNIGAEKMEMVVLYGRRLYFARNLTPGSNIFTEAIRQELRIPFGNAEKMKRERGRIGDARPQPDDDVPVIPIVGGPEGAIGNPDDEDTALGSAADEEMIPKIVDEPPPAPELRGEDPIRRVLESAAHSLVNSIQSCLRYAKAQTKLPNLNVSRIYITGGGSKLPGLARHIQTRLGIETQVFNPLENVEYARVDPIGREMLDGDPGAFVTALGLVAGRALDESIDMSLLPKSEKQRQEFMKHGVYGWAAAGVFGVAVAAMIAGSIFSAGRLRDFTREQAKKIDSAQTNEKELSRLKVENAGLAAKVDRLEEIILEGRTYLSAISVLKGKNQDGGTGYQFPREVMLKSLRTYAGSSPPAHRTVRAEVDRWDRRTNTEKQPKVLVVAGSVSEKVSPDDSRDIVRKLIEYLDDVRGPMGRREFSRIEPLKAIAEGERPRDFEIKLVLNEE